MDKETLKRNARMKQLEFQVANAELKILEKQEEIELLEETMVGYKDELEQFKSGKTDKEE